MAKGRYLNIVFEFIYGELGATAANIIVGLMSALVDNIPIMFAVLTMNPDMPEPSSTRRGGFYDSLR
ncbi:hypothetical protein NP590_12290 [Methylomonas sp. SURF-2]|uniref:Uncharacterized protein n=1 Tax=Methylomonas subterranea TaxID=2952225 RepID=A0ABT1THF2_9GAMM|nr:hypothetical protein [Methylomonas sp. SURF-2]MCQ8104886.1 hypothetical protein [Methylomonas sp. SURF-2]